MSYFNFYKKNKTENPMSYYYNTITHDEFTEYPSEYTKHVKKDSEVMDHLRVSEYIEHINNLLATIHKDINDLLIKLKKKYNNSSDENMLLLKIEEIILDEDFIINKIETFGYTKTLVKNVEKLDKILKYFGY